MNKCTSAVRTMVDRVGLVVAFILPLWDHSKSKAIKTGHKKFL
jgi:hypothetical protein